MSRSKISSNIIYPRSFQFLSIDKRFCQHKTCPISRTLLQPCYAQSTIRKANKLRTKQGWQQGGVRKEKTGQPKMQLKIKSQSLPQSLPSTIKQPKNKCGKN